MSSDQSKTVKLVSISQYAQSKDLDRQTVYEKINKGVLTRYERFEKAEDTQNPEIKGEPLLDIDQDPQLRPYTKSLEDDIV